MVLWLLLAAVLISASSRLRRVARQTTLGAPEKIWFHLMVTWPVIFKTVIGWHLVPPTVSGDDSTRILILAYFPGACASIALTVIRLRKRVAIYGASLPILMVLLLFLILAPSNHSVISTTAATIMYMPAVVIPAGQHMVQAWSQPARVGIVVCAWGVVAAAMFTPSAVIGQCRVDKCTNFGEVLTSPLTGNGNYLGIAMVLLIPLAAAGLSRVRLLGLVAGAAIFVEASGSRSALAALAVGAVVALVVPSVSVARRVVPIALTMTLIVTVYLALVPFPPERFTGRASLWQHARDLWQRSPFWGYGPTYWGHQAQTTEFAANYGTHNIVLELAVSGGIFALAACFGAGILVLHTLKDEDRVLMSLLLFFIVALGWFESPLQIGRLGLTPFCGVLPFVLGAAAVKKANLLEKEVGREAAPSNSGMLGGETLPPECEPKHG